MISRRVIGFIFFFLPLFASAQGSKKQLKNAREPVDSSWVVLKSGEKRNIKDISFPRFRKATTGKIEFDNGEKIGFTDGDVIACQTDQGFYKLAYYDPNTPDGPTVGGNNRLAARQLRGVLNVYQLLVTYRVPFKGTMESTLTYFVEQNNDGKLVSMGNDTTIINWVADRVSKSQKAMEIVAKLRRTYGKISFGGPVPNQLINAIEAYNEDAAAGKLSE